MNKLVIGLASIFAVFVAITVFLDAFKGFQNKTESALSTRYGATVESAIDSGSVGKEANAPTLKTFTNTEFDYELKYPAEVIVDCGTKDVSTEEQSKVCLYISKPGVSKSNSLTMYIDVRDPNLFSTRYEDTMEKRLKDYADTIWQLNRDKKSNDKRVSTLDSIKVAGRSGYQFTTTYNYIMETGTKRVDEKTTVIFFDDSDRIKFNITYPTGEEIFENILDTLKLI